MNKKSLVSIIIVNFNGRKYLEQCLKSLMNNDYGNIQVIIVDNNSTDDSIEFVKRVYPSVIIIKLDKNYGFAEPNNIGAKNAKGEFVLFLNNDTQVDPHFITEMIKVFEKDPKIAICQSLLLKPNGEVESSGDFLTILGIPYKGIKKQSKIIEILSARGASMMVRKDYFWDLGGFDEKIFASFEDVDLGWRAWIWGYKVVLAPNSIVHHLGGKTVTNMSSEIKFHGVKNSIMLNLTNFEINFALNNIIKLFYVNFMRKIFSFSEKTHTDLDYTLPPLRIALRGILWNITNARHVIGKRKKINSRRIRSTNELIKIGVITRPNPNK